MSDQKENLVTEEKAVKEEINKEVKETKKVKEKKVSDPAVRKKRKRIVWISILLIVLLIAVILKLAGGEGAQAYVTTAPCVKGEIEQTINTSGTVTTEQTKVYFSDVSVKVGSVEVEAGDAVNAGDVLLVYDSEDMEMQKNLAELKLQSAEGSYQNSVESNSEKLNDLKEAEVNLEVLDQQIADTEAYIKGLEDKIAQKQSDLAYEGTLLQISLLDWKDKPDSDEYLNLQKLVQINSYEQQNNEEIKSWKDELEVYNDMLADYKEYRSEMKSQKSSAEAGRLSSGAREELEATGQSNEMEAKDKIADLEAAQDGITAEFAGVVTEVNVIEGSTAAAGTQLMKLESTEDVMVRISVTKYDLDKIALGQKAVVTIGSREYEGEVSKINKMAEKNASGAAVVGTQIKILNPDREVFLGVEAKVVICTAQEKDAVLVPTGAVNVDMEGEFVYTVENNVLVKKRIVTGISSDTMVQVTEGLTEGERLVTDVTTALEEGMIVMEIPESGITE